MTFLESSSARSCSAIDALEYTSQKPAPLTGTAGMTQVRKYQAASISTVSTLAHSTLQTSQRANYQRICDNTIESLICVV